MEKKDPPVFSKTAKIFIVAIFILLFLASFAVTMYLIDLGYPEQFKLYNLVPIIFIASTIVSAIYSYRYRHKGISVYFNPQHHPSWPERIKENYDVNFLRIQYLNILIFLAQIPFQIPLIVYIEDIQCMWSLFTYLAPLPIHGIIELIVYNLPSKRKERKNRLENEDLYERDILQQRFRDRY